MNIILARLAEPFRPEDITWKPGATTKDGTKCMAMAYADLRAYMERLDEVCDMGWNVEYLPWAGDRIIARLTIDSTTRASTGEMSKQDLSNELGGMAAEAQAFKRACAMFGLGRSLYDLPTPWVEFDSQHKRISEAGRKELDTKYKAWYARQMAERAAGAANVMQQGNRTSAPPNAPQRPSADAQGDVLFEKPAQAERPVGSQMQLNKIHALGLAFYGNKDKWSAARPTWIDDASGGHIALITELSPEQCDWVIAGLEKRIRETAQPVAA